VSDSLAQYAHWHSFFEDATVSPKDFYKSLEKALADRQVPKVETEQITFPEGGMFSPQRLYLKIERDFLKYQICVGPFGTGFFVSSRLLVSQHNIWRDLVGLIVAMFVIMLLVFVAFTPRSFGTTLMYFFPLVFVFGIIFLVRVAAGRMTYYRLDTMIAFQEAVHRLLIATVNQVMETSGRKPLSAEESKPVLHKLLQR